MQVVGDAIFYEGIGYIGQYHSYVDTFWGKGICYFLRDSYYRELAINDTQQLRRRISSLQNCIAAFEACPDHFLAAELRARHGLDKG